MTHYVEKVYSAVMQCPELFIDMDRVKEIKLTDGTDFERYTQTLFKLREIYEDQTFRRNYRPTASSIVLTISDTSYEEAIEEMKGYIWASIGFKYGTIRMSNHQAMIYLTIRLVEIIMQKYMEKEAWKLI